MVEKKKKKKERATDFICWFTVFVPEQVKGGYVAIETMYYLWSVHNLY
jgi:hypothetical protein